MRLASLVVLASCIAGCTFGTSDDGLTGGGPEGTCDGSCLDATTDATGDADTVDAGPVDAASDTTTRDASGGDGAPDAPDAPDAPTSPPQLVQSNVATQSGTSTGVTLAPTKDGDLLVVAIAQESGTAAVISGITDNAPGGTNVYVTANQRSVDTSCNNTSEIWYAKASRAGATSVTVTMSASVSFIAWAAEFSGLSTTSPLATGAVANTQPTAATLSAPTVTTSTANALVVSTAATCGAISGLQAGSAFSALPIRSGEDTAYEITTAVGSYGAVWTYSSGTYNSSTAAFK